MVGRYNRRQTLWAVLAIVGGLLMCSLVFLFFRYLPPFLLSRFGYRIPTGIAYLIGLGGLGVAFYSGYKTWKTRGGLYSYHESALYHDLGEDTTGAAVVDFYAHRVTAPAYLLGQIFMLGPLWLLRARALFASRIPSTPGLETRLENTLAALRSANKWQGLADHPSAKSEILHLAQMDLIDFSAQKGSPRFKAR